MTERHTSSTSTSVVMEEFHMVVSDLELTASAHG